MSVFKDLTAKEDRVEDSKILDSTSYSRGSMTFRFSTHAVYLANLVRLVAIVCVNATVQPPLNTNVQEKTQETVLESGYA